MPVLFGRQYTRAELLARVGDISQLARIKPYRLIEGAEDGVSAIDVVTGSGLEFTVLGSRGLDISTARYMGRPLAWRSSTGDRHPAYFDHEGEAGRGWLRSFYGGLVVTCGLSYAGAAGPDESGFYGIHGRVSNLPAYQVQCKAAWENDEYRLTVSGRVRETTVFGENLELQRSISTSLGSRSLTIHDTVVNLGCRAAEHMMLYHINLGFPVLADGSRLLTPSMEATPRDAEAQAGRELLAHMQPPEAGYREKVYFHELAADTDGKVTCALVNPDMEWSAGGSRGIGVYCRYDLRSLPRFIEWKMMDCGTYVLGMEPANCLVMGRAHERSAGTLQTLEAGEQREYEIEIGVLEGEDEITRQEASCRSATDAAGSKLV